MNAPAPAPKELAPMQDEPYGYCHCLCGQKTTIVKGVPRRYIKGHTFRRVGPEYIEDPDSGCWIWQGQTTDQGYGLKNVRGRVWRAHRWYYAERRGSIPTGAVLHHRCENPACVNPDHLEPTKQHLHARHHLGGGSSRFQGVSWDTYWNHWRVRIMVGGVNRSGGSFDDELEAAKAAQAFRDEHVPDAPRDPELDAARTALEAPH